MHFYVFLIKLKTIIQGVDMQQFLTFLNTLGGVMTRFFYATGELAIFTGKVIGACIRRPFYLKELLRQLIEIGFYSLPVVALTTLFWK